MEDILKADVHRRIVRIGKTVRRPMYPWSDSIHLLLQHLEGVGFPYSPRFLGIDDEGREVLTFIDGIAGGDGYIEGVEFGAHVWAMVASDAGLKRFARLLRDYHDAVSDFSPPSDSTWSTGVGTTQAGQAICHGDFGPWNAVWDPKGTPVGIIDWDYAAPGSFMEDVAYALWWSVPFCPDEDCVKWRRFDAPPNRRARIELFASSYGLTSASGLIDAVVGRQRQFRALCEKLGTEGVQPAADELNEGYLDLVDEWIEWSEQHRHLSE